MKHLKKYICLASIVLLLELINNNKKNNDMYKKTNMYKSMFNTNKNYCISNENGGH